MSIYHKDEKLEEIIEKIHEAPDFPVSSIIQMIVEYATDAYNAGLEEGKKIAHEEK